MGLFGDRSQLRPDHRSRLVQAANQAWSILPGSLDGAVLKFKGAEVNFLDAVDRENFRTHLANSLRSFANTPRPMGTWVTSHAELSADADRFTVASMMVIKAMVILDGIAEAELQFPKDKRIRSMRQQLHFEMFGALERYYGREEVAMHTLQLKNLARALIGPLADE